jgi:hypothetical protein
VENGFTRSGSLGMAVAAAFAVGDIAEVSRSAIGCTKNFTREG